MWYRGFKIERRKSHLWYIDGFDEYFNTQSEAKAFIDLFYFRGGRR